MPMGPPRRPVRIANCSGFFGDRRSAAREIVDGGPIDVLTGDWLAELTMLILARGKGYASTFVSMVGDVLDDCLAKGVRIVGNGGGLDPAGCAALIAERHPTARVAFVDGDDLRGRLDGHELVNLDTGEAFGDRTAITANAYLGGRGIAEALSAGADVVVTGRVTDAALVVGPAAWWHDWAWDDLDALAGAVVAGHAIECGAQVTGGNYAFFGDIADLRRPGFPIAEVAADGSSVITKHPGTGGAVSEGTVTAQLLYEIAGPRYANPDVTARFDTIRLTDLGDDRVAIAPVAGEAPPPTSKVAINHEGGFRNSLTFVLTGLHPEAKAALALDALQAALPVMPTTFEVTIKGPGLTAVDPSIHDEAHTFVHVEVADAEAVKVGRAFSNAAVELALANYPGFFMTSPPRAESPVGVYWPTTIPLEVVDHAWTLEGVRHPVAGPAATAPAAVDLDEPGTGATADGPTVPLGRIVGARSGDKGGAANVGLWVKTDEAFVWLDAFLTSERLRTLLPEADGLEVRRFRLPNLRALNFVVAGFLGRGVSSNTRTDAQAKGLGEFLRARLVPIPERLL